MRQNTKVQRRVTKAAPAASPPADIDDAVLWLSEHLGFPAPSRKDYETRVHRPRRA